MAILNQCEAGAKLTGLYQEHGMSEATFHEFRSNCGGIDASLLQRTNELESENHRLEKGTPKHAWYWKPSHHDRCPDRIQIALGSEFVSRILDKWTFESKLTLDFSRPEKPTDNSLIESFYDSFRDEGLNSHCFLSPDDAREKIDTWREGYNTFRSHSSLKNLTPIEYRDRHPEAGNLNI